MSTATISPYTWKPAYSVKIQAMDAEHQRLVGLIAKLQDAMAKGEGRTVLNGVLDELVRYTRIHFANEEALMERHGYPDLASHRVIHAALTEKVLQYQSRLKAGELTLSVQMLEFLKHWLTGHIQGTDMNYSAYLNAKGVK